MAGSTTLQKYSKSKGRIRVNKANLKPSSTVYAFIASTPTTVGTYAVAPNGTVSFEADVPLSLKAGYHTLHLQAESYSGESVDFWQIVRVLGKEGDIDEDGIGDSGDRCMFMQQLDRDRDGDGVDDGCDVAVSQLISNNQSSTLGVVGINDEKVMSDNDQRSGRSEAAQKDTQEGRDFTDDPDTVFSEYLRQINYLTYGLLVSAGCAIVLIVMIISRVEHDNDSENKQTK